MFADARYQRCTRHFSVTPRNKMKSVAMTLKAIHAREKAHQVTEKLKEMNLGSAAKKLQDGIEETLPTWAFLPSTGPESVPTT